MDRKNTGQEEIITRAERIQHFCDLLICQCDNWLPFRQNKIYTGHRKCSTGQSLFPQKQEFS
jgi:hypothetical protein